MVRSAVCAWLDASLLTSSISWVVSSLLVSQTELVRVEDDFADALHHHLLRSSVAEERVCLLVSRQALSELTEGLGEVLVAHSHLFVHIV